AGAPSNNTRLTLERSELHGGGTYLTEEGAKKGPSYAQESVNLKAAEGDGRVMGSHIFDAMAGQRGGWQNGNIDSAILNQAVLTATLTGLIESIRTPFVLVPNVGAVNTSRLGGHHIGNLAEGLPLSGKAAIMDKKQKIADHGKDSYEVIGGQKAGRQTEWLLAVRRASGAQTYFNNSSGFSTSGSVGTGYLKPVPLNKSGHLAPEIVALTRQFQVPATLVQQAFNLPVTEKRVSKKLWERVDSEINNNNAGSHIQPPSPASEEVLRRTAANMRLWADAMQLDYSESNSEQAKGDFLLKIWHELTGMFGVTSDPTFEQRLRRIANG
ncbi:hypothetical protein, partial [Streptomyces sp. NPDC060210]|uniref:hypothetical protein n=1 Tax=Streptomyces sp. NPDC060210 TaxID=3347074 RepID=UPI00365E12D1